MSTPPRSKLNRWWLFGAIGLVLLLSVSPLMYRWYAVAQLQRSVERGWEVYVHDTPGSYTTPDWIAFPTSRIIEWATTNRKDNLGDILYQRTLSLFEGPIREIEIIDPHAFHGDPGSALLRFPRVEHVVFYQSDPTLPAEAEYQRFCQGLRQLPKLERLDLTGGELTDEAIAPLAGHPAVRELTLGKGSITPEAADTLVTMPKLETVVMHADHWSTQQRSEFSARLPKVKVRF